MANQASVRGPEVDRILLMRKDLFILKIFLAIGRSSEPGINFTNWMGDSSVILHCMYICALGAKNVQYKSCT
jgi:hypothetical protein